MDEEEISYHHARMSKSNSPDLALHHKLQSPKSEKSQHGWQSKFLTNVLFVTLNNVSDSHLCPNFLSCIISTVHAVPVPGGTTGSHV